MAWIAISRRWFPALVLLAGCGLFLAVFRAPQPSPPPTLPLAPGVPPVVTSEELAALRFADRDGKPLALTAFTGKVVLLDYWATWCAPCVAEFPVLDRLEAEFGQRGLAVVAVSIDRTGRETVDPFWARLGLKNFTPYFDGQQSGPDLLKLRGVPTAVLIDKRGKPVELFEGSTDWDAAAFRSTLSQLLAAR